MKVLKKLGGFLKKHVKLLIVIAIIVAVVLFARHKMKAAQKQMEEQMNQPVTSTIDQMDLQKSVSVTGTLTANETAKVTSTIGGSLTGIKVKKVNYQVGDYVEAGAVVVEFDGDDYDRKIAELNAQYNIENKETDVNIADIQKKIKDTNDKIEEAKKWLAERKKYYDNLKDAYDKYIEHQDWSDRKDRYESESAICLSRWGFSLESYEAKEDEIEALQDSIVTYQNQIELAQLKQAFSKNYTQVDAKDDVYESKDATSVSAPIAGYIIDINVEEGNNYTQGNTVFTIADTTGFVVEATANEYDIANIATDLPAKVKFEATGDETFDGQVTFVSLASESTINSSESSLSTGSAMGSSVANYKIKIKLNDNDKRLRVGMTAKASVIMDSVSNALCVPYDCLQQDEDESYFVNTIGDDGKKKKVKVTKGLESDYYVEIKGEGLKKGMTVEAVVDDGPSTDVMDYMWD